MVLKVLKIWVGIKQQIKEIIGIKLLNKRIFVIKKFTMKTKLLNKKLLFF